ncbi:MAG: response regulator [Candidatus Sulfotelmatobacter sp.]|jgi:CheY-like chemotaxis protein
MPPSAYPELSRGVVLCIDDDQNVLECEKAFLETFGYIVLTASSGARGLELASSRLVDVVIVGYFMPEMNGEEFAIEMRLLRPQAPIIMLSAAVDVPEQALKLVDAFIAKDHLSSQLLPVIAQLHECGLNPTLSYDAWRGGAIERLYFCGFARASAGNCIPGHADSPERAAAC